MNDAHVRQRMALLETRVLDLHARVRGLAGSSNPADTMDRHHYLDLLCHHLSELVALRRELSQRMS